ncbi:MAG: MBOAT family protein [Candidatus Zixiibacteriota bacterium]|nr:MAG: MBOAT family protein [candidate division Zixibacteria bacterium]
MLFNSLEFLVFFPTVVIIYFLLPHRFRWVMLLAASYYFYMCWKPEYVVLIMVSTLIDYFAGLRMGRLGRKTKRRKYLLLSLLANIGLLFSFKYFNFFSESARLLLAEFNIFYGSPVLDVLLPVGISFYTFQTLSYTIDVYRGARPPERHLGIFALYVSFFPQLVAGPIERSTRLLPQFLEKKSVDVQRMADGVRLMMFGFFKKVVIADRLAVYVNNVYNHPDDHSGLTLIVATYFFAIQIYCDFSGYSNIAIGAARVLGYDLMTNFNRPYISRSVAEFWKRWHISLSSWFKDYLYIPLGGNRVGRWRWHYNIAVVFLVSGLWHGANWTFLAWGMLHGIYLMASTWTRDWRDRMWRLVRPSGNERLRLGLSIFITFHLVLFAWIFFRANSIGDAWVILQGIAETSLTNFKLDIPAGFHRENLMFAWFELLLAGLSVAVMAFISHIHRNQELRLFMGGRARWQRWAVDYALILGIFLMGVYEHAEFIYFQF